MKKGEVMRQVSAFLNDRGQEVVDSTPLEAPLRVSVPSSSTQSIRAIVQREMSRLAELDEMETFEEADDFDIEDDPVDPRTPYEAVFDPIPLDEPLQPPVAAAPEGGVGGPPPANNAPAATAVAPGGVSESKS